MIFNRLIKAWQRWQQQVYGASVRGQQVDGARMIVENLRPGEPPKFIVEVFFKENPLPYSLSMEERLLARVMSDIPRRAATPMMDYKQLLRVLKGKEQAEFILEDEVGERTTISV